MHSLARFIYRCLNELFRIIEYNYNDFIIYQYIDIIYIYMFLKLFLIFYAILYLNDIWERKTVTIIG